jgi:AAA+ ATPase superfamily predicted ATPase
MENNKLNYVQYAAFINRETELEELGVFILKEPSEILFIHGPKSSGKTTLLYKFFEQVGKEQKLDVKFLNLRKILTEFEDNYNYRDFLNVFFGVDDKKEKTGKFSGEISVGFFKINSEIEKKMKKGQVDPFKVMEQEFIRLKEKGIKPVLIIDELQALDKIYMNNGRDRQLIIELFNFFVAMTKESHLAHIIIASSDGYFLNTVYTDSRLKKASKFYKVDYLCKKDVLEWLLNLEKYSKIKDYTLTGEDIEKIWDTVGGSMWEIQDILTELFNNPIDRVLNLYKRKIKATIEYYIGADMQREKVLRIFLKKETARIRDFINEGITPGEVDQLLQDTVRNNILYFDPTEALYYPQGKSYQWGIKLYFESIDSSAWM